MARECFTHCEDEGCQGETMIFVATEIPGVHIVELEKRADERGFFARGWCSHDSATAVCPTASSR